MQVWPWKTGSQFRQIVDAVITPPIRLLRSRDPGMESQFVSALECRRSHPSVRKFLKIVRPSSVRMLSGWNWTPQMG